MAGADQAHIRDPRHFRSVGAAAAGGSADPTFRAHRAALI